MSGTYTWSYSYSGQTSGQGQDTFNITVTSGPANANGLYTAQGVTGTFDGFTITGLNGDYGGPDNTLSATTFGYFDGLDYNGVSFDLSNGGMVNILSNNYDFDYEYSANNVLEEASPTYSNTVCFVEGTLIETSVGPVAVQYLSAGDTVVTASGVVRQIRWVGNRSVDCSRHPKPELVWPVRISANAFGEALPRRNLFVSPGHSIAVDLLGELLIPAGSLLNGATIYQTPVERVTYWHIELDSHDLLLAEGLPAESYLDMDNRSFFQSGGVVALLSVPDAANPAQRTHADFCRPFHDCGPLVAFANQRLRDRARLLGWVLEADPWADAHLVIQGRRIDGVTQGNSIRFRFQSSAESATLVSRSAKPADLGLSDDCRRLGLGLSAIVFSNHWCDARPISLDDQRLKVGFHTAEALDGVLRRRWTNGRAELPQELWAGLDDTVTLQLDLAEHSLPLWRCAALGRAVGVKAAS